MFTVFLCPHKMTWKQKRLIQLLSIVLGCMTLDDWNSHHLLTPMFTHSKTSSFISGAYTIMTEFSFLGGVLFYEFVLM